MCLRICKCENKNTENKLINIINIYLHINLKYINCSSIYVIFIKKVGSNYLIHHSWKKSRGPNISPIRLAKIAMLTITHAWDCVENLFNIRYAFYLIEVQQLIISHMAEFH